VSDIASIKPNTCFIYSAPPGCLLLYIQDGKSQLFLNANIDSNIYILLLLGLITNNNKEIIFVNKGLIFLQKFNRLFNWGRLLLNSLFENQTCLQGYYSNYQWQSFLTSIIHSRNTIFNPACQKDSIKLIFSWNILNVPT